MREQSDAPRSDRLGCIGLQVKIYPREILSTLSLSVFLLKRDTEESSKRVARGEERRRRRVGNKARGKKKRREEKRRGIGGYRREGRREEAVLEGEGRGGEGEKTASANVTGLHSDVGV